MKEYKVVCYFYIPNIRRELKISIVNLLKSNAQLFIKKGTNQGYNLSIHGFKNLEDAYNALNELTPLVSEEDYIYSDDDYKILRLTNKENFKPEDYLCNKVIVELDDLYTIFENKEQYELYKDVERYLDKMLIDKYFQDNDIFQMINLILNTSKEFEGDGYVSHLSHFWFFFQTLEQEQKKGVYKLFKEKAKLYKKTNDSSFDLSFLKKRVTYLIHEEKLNYYSPTTKDIVKENKMYASEVHKKTLYDEKYQKAIYRDVSIITNRWFLNVFYEKLILMNITIIEKFFLNYVISLNRPNTHINESIEFNLKTGVEKLW